MGKCKFRRSWMKKKDKGGVKISSWASKLNEVEALCKVCSTTINYSSKGFHAFIQHANSNKHKKFYCDLSKQMVLVAGTSNQPSNNKVNSTSSLTQMKLYSVRNAATISELIWVMKSVCGNYSAASCHNIKDTFLEMFPEGVPKEFSLSPKKMNYLITDALQPYFYQLLIEDIGTSYFTICFDETTNVKDKKELQIVARYWSKEKDEVVTRHLQTYLIGKADAKVLFEKISCAIKNANLSLQNLLMIGSDGPNVNKKVQTMFNENLLDVRSFGPIDFGTCPIHIVHNAYLKALQTFSEDASDLAICIYHYLNGWPFRWEDYEKIQEEFKLPFKKFVKHSPSRWLTFHHAAKRLIEQWAGITHYFLKFIPLKKSEVMQSRSYKRISNLIRDQSIKAEIYFTMSSAELFMSFTEAFQKDEPLVHILYVNLQELVGKLARRVCKKFSENYDELFETQNMLPLKDIVVCQNVKKELAHLNEKVSSTFMRSVKDHSVNGCNFLIKKALSNCYLARYLRCLNPAFIKNKKSCQDIVEIARNDLL